MELVFFGSGPVAKKSLELLSKNFKIEAIITKTSTKAMMSSVLPTTQIYCVDNKTELDNLMINTTLKSKIAILIDFGIIVSKNVINYFPKGIVNSHFSHLPYLRGADPITFSLLSGQKTTGVSLMIIDEGMDTGKIIVQKSIKINNTDDSLTLTEKLITLSDNLIKKYLTLYLSEQLKPRSQPHVDRATYTRKLTKKDGEIDWSKPAEIIEREIRAYISWPRSYTKIKNLDLIIKKAKVTNQQGPPGFLSTSKNGLIIFCGKDALSIETLQPAGKKEMPVKAFLAGYKL